jgi:protein-S-isoprenylcysteine O-methyltransferase Ste14
MALSVKVAIGTFLWFGVFIGFVIVIALIATYINKTKKQKEVKPPEDPPKAAPAVTLHVVKKKEKDGGTENGL